MDCSEHHLLKQSKLFPPFRKSITLLDQLITCTLARKRRSATPHTRCLRFILTPKSAIEITPDRISLLFIPILFLCPLPIDIRVRKLLRKIMIRRKATCGQSTSPNLQDCPGKEHHLRQNNDLFSTHQPFRNIIFTLIRKPNPPDSLSKVPEPRRPHQQLRLTNNLTSTSLSTSSHRRSQKKNRSDSLCPSVRAALFHRLRLMNLLNSCQLRT